MVLLACYSGEFGGAERLLVQFARALEGGVCLACPPGPLADAARFSGLTVLTLPQRRLNLRGERMQAIGRVAAHGLEIRRLARDLAPELVIAWGMRSALACLLGPALEIPVVFQHNDLLPGRAIGLIVRRAARRAAGCIALSHAIADELKVACEVVHPGVEPQPQTPVPAGAPCALVLGAITGWKRPDLALEAVALARRSLPALRLRVVGAPMTQEANALLGWLTARASEPDLAGAVELAGLVPAGIDELAGATCLLHCAPQEPFGMAVLEALAAGRPAIVPGRAGPAEIVDDSCGRLYAPGDAQAAARALVEVASDPDLAARLGAAGRERARRCFGVERAAREYAAAVGRARPVRASGAAGASAVAGAALTLVTVTRNSRAELAALLRGVARYLPGARVVVVDCASADGTLDVAAGASQVVALPENVGFARACNLGMTKVLTPVTALVNPDVELIDGSLGELAEEALREAPERLLAPLVLLGDGRRQDSVHPLPASPADLIRSVVPPGALAARLALPLAPWRSEQPRRVGWAVGCAIVARTATLRRLGPFDERLFLYGEDLDLGLRAAREGVQSWFCPSARIIHHRAHSSEREFGGEAFEALARARHEVVARQLGRRRAAVDDFAQAATFRSRRWLKRALGLSAAREALQLDALRAARSER